MVIKRASNAPKTIKPWQFCKKKKEMKKCWLRKHVQGANRYAQLPSPWQFKVRRRLSAGYLTLAHNSISYRKCFTCCRPMCSKRHITLKLATIIYTSIKKIETLPMRRIRQDYLVKGSFNSTLNNCNTHAHETIAHNSQHLCSLQQ